MALNVQDSTGEVAGANGYVSVADFTLWHAARGVAFTQVNALIEAAIVRATDYIDTRFAFSGAKKATNQTTEFPRYGDDDIPVEIVTACIIYAAQALVADLWQTTEEIASGNLKSLDESIGPIIDKKEWFSPSGRKKSFEQADALIEKSGYVGVMNMVTRI